MHQIVRCCLGTVKMTDDFDQEFVGFFQNDFVDDLYEGFHLAVGQDDFPVNGMFHRKFFGIFLQQSEVHIQTGCGNIFRLINLYIVDLGLIYELKYDGDKTIDIDLTFSTPSCPLGDTIISGVKETIKKKYPDFTTNVEVVFDPPWNTEMVSEDGRRMLGM